MHPASSVPVACELAGGRPFHRNLAAPLTGHKQADSILRNPHDHEFLGNPARDDF